MVPSKKSPTTPNNNNNKLNTKKSTDPFVVTASPSWFDPFGFDNNNSTSNNNNKNINNSFTPSVSSKRPNSQKINNITETPLSTTMTTTTTTTKSLKGQVTIGSNSKGINDPFSDLVNFKK
jgi:hypothetical protein